MLSATVEGVIEELGRLKVHLCPPAVGGLPCGPGRTEPEEIVQRVKRSFNIIMRNVLEMTDSDDRIKADSMFRCIDESPGNLIVETRHIGRGVPNNPRMFKVALMNSDIVSTTLRNKKKLQSFSGFKNVDLSDDKIPNQISELNERRELKRGELAEEVDLTIKYILQKIETTSR